MISMQEVGQTQAVIKVIGVGGCGGNAVKRMIERGMSDVEFIAANTDMQALVNNPAPIKIQLGEQLTKGLGAGNKPDIGRQAAEEARDIIKDWLEGANMVFVTCGMGGGTGTGASPVIAEIAKSVGALVVGVVTTPFSFEGPVRRRYAEAGISNLREFVDNIIIVPNQKVRSCRNERATVAESYEMGSQVLINSVQGVCDIITNTGFVNLDFADVRTVMEQRGSVLMGMGFGTGPNAAEEALEKAINDPLLDDYPLKDINSALLNVTASSSFDMGLYEKICDDFYGMVDVDNVLIKTGLTFDESMGDEVKITIIATGSGMFENVPTDRDIKREREVKIVAPKITETVNQVTPKQLVSKIKLEPVSKPVHTNLDLPLGDNDDKMIPAYLRHSTRS